MKNPAALRAWALGLMLLALARVHGYAADEEMKTRSRQQPHSFEKTITRQIKLNYLMYLQEGYSDNAKKEWPLMLFLHGAGERGTNLSRGMVHGPPKIVSNRTDFAFILVSPQCPTGERWDNESLLALLDDVITKHKVDRSRVYLTGLSMGGYGTWSLGIAKPERFAA